MLKDGTLLRIIAPSNRGKTSLMARILNYGQTQGYHTVRLSLLRAGTNIFSSEEKFMRWFCASVTQQLQLESKLDDYCNEDMGSLLNCTLYFQDYLLAEINCPLILAIDEINQLFEYPELARNFLSLLGSWHQETKDISIWQKLRLIIVHTTDLNIPLALNKSMFNVGLVIELKPFTQDEIIDLANRCGLKLLASELEGLMELTGGFPYLLRLLFDHCVSHNIAVKKILENTICETHFYHQHMHEQFWLLREHANLADAFKRVLTADSPIELEIESALKLKSLGLVHMQGIHATVSCGLYRDYFQKCCLDLEK
ncbi:MAG: AAA-like domain-containing protein [Methylococcaceae bacterium]